MKKSIAILITVFNRKEKTINCLHSIYKQNGLEDYCVDIFIVDGGSTDGTPDAIKSQFPKVHVSVHNGLYWNRGMYTAWEEAAKSNNYDFYLWLNDDTILYDDSIKRLVEASTIKNSESIIIGATVDTDTHSIQTYGGRDPKGSLLTLDGTLKHAHHFNGNIVLVPNTVFLKIGNLDPYFTHSKGDFEYGLRASKAGIQSLQLGTPLGECDNHPTLDKWCNPKVTFMQRWKAMHMPNGMPPNETFHLEKKYIGMTSAIFHWVTIHIRCIFPKLWT